MILTRALFRYFLLVSITTTTVTITGCASASRGDSISSIMANHVPSVTYDNQWREEIDALNFNSENELITIRVRDAGYLVRYRYTRGDNLYFVDYKYGYPWMENAAPLILLTEGCSKGNANLLCVAINTINAHASVAPEYSIGGAAGSYHIVPRRGQLVEGSMYLNVFGLDHILESLPSMRMLNSSRPIARPGFRNLVEVYMQAFDLMVWGPQSSEAIRVEEVVEGEPRR